MGDCPSYDHGRQAQIRKQADPFCTGGDPKAFQDLSKKTALFLAEDLAVLPGEPLKNLLLLLDRQYGDPLFFSITAVMKEFPDPLRQLRPGSFISFRAYSRTLGCCRYRASTIRSSLAGKKE